MSDLFGYHDGDRALARARRRVFTVTVLGVLLLGALLTLAQPRQYRAGATVLMTAPTAVDETVEEADVQGVAIQARVLLGSEVLRRLAQVLGDESSIDTSATALRPMLDVAAVPDTHLLELSAAGAERAALPTIVGSWIEVYADVRAAEVAERQATTVAEVRAEVASLVRQIDQARRDLDRFRSDNGIISIERAENAVLARLQGLNESLNAALDEQVRAQAALDTLRASLAAGEQVVPEGERGEVAAMAEELGRLRARLAELQARYTREYIRKDPRLRDIPEQIESLQSAIGRAYSEGSSVALEQAQRARDAADATVNELRRRLAEHREEVAAFNSTYATHAAMVEDLARLEELHREALGRLAQVEARRVDRFPQMSVIDPPPPVALRTGPDYLLFLGGTCLAALFAGIFAVWLHGYLNPRRREPTFVAVAGMPLQQPAQDAQPARSLPRDHPARLASPESPEPPERPDSGT
mgnify:CR=1 FL=1